MSGEISKDEALTDTKKDVTLDVMMHKGILIAKCEIDEIQKFEMRDDDVWVCTFPRSGTTLTQEIVYLVMTLDFEKANSVQLDDRFPIIDVKNDKFPYYRVPVKGPQVPFCPKYRPHAARTLDKTKDDPKLVRYLIEENFNARPRAAWVKHVEQMQSPRMVKAHAHFDFLPEQLQNGKGRIIYLARNPKDVITSYFHLLQWLNELRDYNDTWPKFFNSFVEGKALHCPWPRHVLKYWERRNDSNVLFLKYENLIKDLPNGVRTIAKFLGKEISDENVARICDHCSVQNMKTNENVNLSYWREFKNVNDEAGGGFINKGKSGVWKHILSPEESEKIDVLLKEVQEAGLTFDT